MKKKTVSLILASSIVLSTFSPVIAAENLINLQDAEVAQQIEALAEGNNCQAKEIYEEAANGMFNKIGEKSGIYKATYYPNAKIAEILIIDKSKDAKELTESNFVDEIYNLYKNHNLVKFKIGNETEKHLNILAKDLEEAEIKNTFKNSFSTDLINAVQTGGTGTGKLSDFVNKEFQIQLTFQAPNCNNSVDLTYTIRGKEAIASIMNGKLKTKDINVWKGTENINWKDGVEIISQPGNQQGLIDYLEEAKVEDVSNRNTQNSSTQNGNLKLTFTDGTSLLLNDQKLNVSEHILPIIDEYKKAPKDAIDVTFKLGEGIEAGNPTVTGNKKNPIEFSSYKIKPGVDVTKEKIKEINGTIFELINPRAIKGYENPTWKSLSTNPNDFIVSMTNNVFVASATESVSSIPEVNIPIDGAKTITGTGVKDATINVTVPGIANSIETKVDGNSKWEIKLPAGKSLKTGDKLVVTQKEEGKKVSPAKEVIVKEKEKEMPKPIPMPEKPKKKDTNKTPNYYYGFNYFSPLTSSKKKTDSSSKAVATYVFNINKDEFEITINGTTMKSKMYTSPVIRNGRTMLPLRNIAEAIGVEVSWDSKTRTASFTKDGLTASIQIDGDEISYSNGKVVKMDSKPIIKDNRILVSLVNVANIFGLTNGNVGDAKDQDIEWNKDNNTVTIKLQK